MDWDLESRVSSGWGVGLRVRPALAGSTWEFPKIGDPTIVP